MVGRLVADLIIPPALRDAHRDGLARYLRTGRGPVVGRRVELTAMRADGTEFPVELVVTRPNVPGERVFYGYLRDLTARYRAEAALHRLADEQAALRRVATAVAAEGDPSRLFELVTRGGRPAARCRDRGADALRRRSRGRRRCVQQARRARRAGSAPRCRCAPTPPRAASFARARRRGWRTTTRSTASSRASCAGSAFHSSVAAPVFLGGRLWGAMVVLSVEPSSRSRRTPSNAIADFAELAAQALANAQAREELARVARADRAGRATRSGGGWSATCTTARSSGSSSLALMLRLAARRHPERRGSRTRRRGALATRCRSSASWPAASTPRS